MSNCKRQSRAESFLQIKSRRKEQHSKLAVNKLNRANLLDFLVPLLARENRYLPSSGWKVQQQTKLIQASPVFFGVPKQRPETACSFVASPMTGYKDKKRSLIGQVSTDEFGANWFLKMKPRLRLAYFMKGMLFGCEQPFLWGERCVTSQKTAAEETTVHISLHKVWVDPVPLGQISLFWFCLDQSCCKKPYRQKCLWPALKKQA